MPGVSPREAIRTIHHLMTAIGVCAGRTDGNPIREGIEMAAALSGVGFILNDRLGGPSILSVAGVAAGIGNSIFLKLFAGAGGVGCAGCMTRRRGDRADYAGGGTTMPGIAQAERDCPGRGLRCHRNMICREERR